MLKKQIEKVWVDGTHVYARTKDGLEASYPFSRWKRLSEARQEQRENFILSYTGIYWPDLDEDLSFEGMFRDAGLCENTLNEDAVYYEPKK